MHLHTLMDLDQTAISGQHKPWPDRANYSVTCRQATEPVIPSMMILTESKSGKLSIFGRGRKREIDRVIERARLKVGAALSLMMYITVNKVDLIRPAPAPDLFIHRDFHSNKHE